MKIQDDGGPAFPAIGSETFPNDPQGMSLRDWFAGQAIAGRLIDPGVDTDKIGIYAYEIADSMLDERDRNARERK